VSATVLEESFGAYDAYFLGFERVNAALACCRRAEGEGTRTDRACLLRGRMSP
jgi:hypothetical protein